ATGSVSLVTDATRASKRLEASPRTREESHQTPEQAVATDARSVLGRIRAPRPAMSRRIRSRPQGLVARTGLRAEEQATKDDREERQSSETSGIRLRASSLGGGDSVARAPCGSTLLLSPRPGGGRAGIGRRPGAGGLYGVAPHLGRVESRRPRSRGSLAVAGQCVAAPYGARARLRRASGGLCSLSPRRSGW